MIAQELEGKLLLSETADEQGRQLLNIVEEMAIASGISVPEVYLLCKNKLTAEAQRAQREESEIFTTHLGLL